MESQWLDSTIINLFLILHGQCRLVGASLPQSLGTQIDKCSIILSLHCVEHMTFLVRGTDSGKVLYWLFYIEAWKWHTSLLFIVHWPALVKWMPNCKRAGKCGKSAGMFGWIPLFLPYSISHCVDSMKVMEMPTWRLGDRVQQEIVVPSEN